MPITLTEEEKLHFTNPDNEAELVNAIRTHLLSKTQRQQLFDANISVEDILNGRFEERYSTLIDALFTDWNEKLGRRQFHF